MRRCVNCGEPLQDDDLFCPDCGAKQPEAKGDDSAAFPAAPVEIPLTDVLKEALAGEVLHLGLLNGKTPVVCYKGTKKGKLLAVQGTFVVVVWDEVRGPYEKVRELEFSSSGECLVYCVEIEGKSYVVVNGKQYGPHTSSEWTFSDDRSTAACVVELMDGWHVYHGEKEYKMDGECELGKITSSGNQRGPFTNGKDVAYWVRKDHKWFLYKNGEKVSNECHLDKNVIFSPDWETLAYVEAISSDESYINKGGEHFGPYDYASYMIFSPDGKDFVYCAGKYNERIYVYANGEKAGPYKECRSPTFSPDGKTLTYLAETESGWYVFANGEKTGPYSYVNDSIVLSPDSKKIAYAAEIDGKWYIMAGGEKRGPYYDCRVVEFSPDGKTLLYTACLDDPKKWYVYIGDEKHGPYWHPSPHYSANGRAVAYTAKDEWYDPGRDIVILNGREYFGAITGGHAVWLDGGKLYRW